MTQISRRLRKRITQLHKKGLNDLEIASQLDIASVKVTNLRKSTGLFTDEERIHNLKVRRNLFRGGIATLALSATLGTGYLVNQSGTFDYLINRELYAENQKILDQLVQEDPSPHIGKVIYDPTKRYVKVPSTLTKLLDDSEVPAFSLFYAPLFGRGAPSDIYFFRNAFEDDIREFNGIQIVIHGKEKIKVVYKHEWFHTKYQAEGMDFGNGLVLDKTNFNSINPMISTFLNESSAYIDTFEFFRQHGKNKIALAYSAGKTGWITQNYEKFQPHMDKFSRYEIDLLTAQLTRINNMVPELNKALIEFVNNKK